MWGSSPRCIFGEGALPEGSQVLEWAEETRLQGRCPFTHCLSCLRKGTRVERCLGSEGVNGTEQDWEAVFLPSELEMMVQMGHVEGHC